MKRLWKVSLGKNGEFESTAIANSVITIDFSVNRDISDLKDRDQLIALMDELHPEAKSKTRANFAAQINQFKNEMSIGDLVVCPSISADFDCDVDAESDDQQLAVVEVEGSTFAKVTLEGVLLALRKRSRSWGAGLDSV